MLKKIVFLFVICYTATWNAVSLTVSTSVCMPKYRNLSLQQSVSLKEENYYLGQIWNISLKVFLIHRVHNLIETESPCHLYMVNKLII